LSELAATVDGFAEIAVTLLLDYMAYEVAVLVDTLIRKIIEEKRLG
jgi:hypothetical protein